MERPEASRLDIHFQFTYFPKEFSMSRCDALKE
jgi:hypothetical protein